MHFARRIIYLPSKISIKENTTNTNIELFLNRNIKSDDCKIIIKKLKDTY